MKKLYLILFLTIVSYTSMGFGFPANTIEQKKTLVLGTNSKEVLVEQQLDILEENENFWTNDSAVEGLVSFIVRFFTFGFIDYIPN